MSLQPETTYPAILGRVLTEMRSRLGVDQAELASRLGLNQSSWSRIERGETAVNIEQLTQIAEVLRVRPGTIVADADRAKDVLEKQGVKVHRMRVSMNKDSGQQTGKTNGMAMLGAAALGALVGAALTKASDKDG
jgi:transcriptional regulator with XRE-family HTH domain